MSYLTRRWVSTLLWYDRQITDSVAVAIKRRQPPAEPVAITARESPLVTTEVSVGFSRPPMRVEYAPATVTSGSRRVRRVGDIRHSRVCDSADRNWPIDADPA